MTNQRDKRLKTCPLCNTEASITRPNAGPYNISCGAKDDDSDTCGLVLFGDSHIGMLEMIERWNRREVR